MASVKAFSLAAFDNNPFGLPPTFPLALAAFNQTLLLSQIISHSFSAKTALSINHTLPIEVVVSIPWVRLLNSTPFSLNFTMSLMSARVVLPR